jgi:thiamine biosynthesis lipoprotein
MQRHRFPAMGTRVECLVEAPPSPALDNAFAHVEDEFARLEAMLSRFRPDSELSRLNRDGSIEASDELLELTRLALEAREQTGGRFDPTLHDALVAAGYDRTFDELTDGRAELVSRVIRMGSAYVAPPAPGQVVCSGRRIELGPGASLDLGGIAKGYAADRCVARLAEHGPSLVNAGGDLAVSGPAETGPWPVAVDLPRGRLTLAVAGGGIATSGRDRRRWSRDGEERHHIIDPSTLRPAAGCPISVTVTAPSATAAEVSAKALFLAGPNAEREAASKSTGAVIVTEDGDTRLVGLAA